MTAILKETEFISGGPDSNGLGEIPYRPRPIPEGRLATQVSGDRA